MPGYVCGIVQDGVGYRKGEPVITLHMEAYLGAPESYDSVEINGSPALTMKIAGGVHGDIATASIVVNSIPKVLDGAAGPAHDARHADSVVLPGRVAPHGRRTTIGSSGCVAPTTRRTAASSPGSRALPAARAEAIPPDGGWSAAQIGWHVAAVDAAFADLISGQRPSQPLPEAFRERDWSEVAAAIPQKTEASRGVVPPPAVQQDTALAALAASAWTSWRRRCGTSLPIAAHSLVSPTAWSARSRCIRSESGRRRIRFDTTPRRSGFWAADGGCGATRHASSFPLIQP